MSTPPRVVVLDYGSGNVRSAVRALEHVGARVTLTGDPEALAPGMGGTGGMVGSIGHG